MTERNVRIEPDGYLVIDARAWVGLRTGGTEPALTADPRAWAATLTTVFGPSLDAPFSICPDSTAFHVGSRKTPCDCDRSPWILCPTCGQRCGVDLPQP
jgi:hypothetical protein